MQLNHEACITPSSLGYFVFQATDLAAWQRFAVDIIGMQLGDCDPARYLALRLDDQA